MKCPRCDSQLVSVMVKAPVDDAWEVYLCDTCKFSWRSTEGENITDPAEYDKRFKINPDKISSFDQIPPIPKLIKKNA